MEQTLFKSKFKCINTLDKIFIYLMDEEKPVCFWRGNAKDFADENPENQWIVLKADRAIGKIDNDYEAGMLQMRLSVFNRGPSTKNFPDGEG